MNSQAIFDLYAKYVVPTYAPAIALARGEGCWVWDSEGKRYLDFAGGIAVSGLGHAHPKLVSAIAEQAGRLIHTSNLFANEWQGRLAEKLVAQLGPGKCFFANSGAEANEALFKLARKWGAEAGAKGGTPRYEIISMLNSFHGRTLAAVSATGQEKIRKGFEPLPEGFKQVPFNDLEAVKAATGEKTAAVLIEVIQGEGGIKPASKEFLVGLRRWCDEKGLLLLADEIQTGCGRTGRCASYQDYGVTMDGVSLAKSLGGGFPVSAAWIREPFADVLTVGSHATTFGGSPLAMRAACAVLETIESERLMENAAEIGRYLLNKLQQLARAKSDLKEVRGKGLLIGLQLGGDNKTWVAKFREAGLLTAPAGTDVVRLLPPLICGREEADEGVARIEKALS
ncbi:MAG: aspartate aminotransferase family protein [Verrucomicrobiae bacterium]|nr:aspartate aminotransferase family protein [Verrucomicrobiae bacterium]